MTYTHAHQLNGRHACRAVEAREEAMGGKTLCIHNRSHVPDDCLFFRGMSEHIIGLLLTVQKEVRSLVHDLPAMVSSSYVLFSTHITVHPVSLAMLLHGTSHERSRARACE